jgi:hypothetical protein
MVLSDRGMARGTCDLTVVADAERVAFLANAPVISATTPIMAKVHSREIPYLAPRPFGDGSGWFVEAQWVHRAKEKFGHFATLLKPVAG